MIMATYETFAAVYDAVMDDSLYDKWTNFSLRHLPKTKERKKLLELACGTGIQSVRFSQAGFDVTGLDLSADMLKIGGEESNFSQAKIAFIEGNMLNLSKAGKYDFVTCYSDSICYMQDEVEVGDVFKDVYNALNEEEFSSLTCTRPTRQMKYSLAIPTMKMRKILPCFGIHMRTKLLTPSCMS